MIPQHITRAIGVWLIAAAAATPGWGQGLGPVVMEDLQLQIDAQAAEIAELRRRLEDQEFPP